MKKILIVGALLALSFCSSPCSADTFSSSGSGDTTIFEPSEKKHWWQHCTVDTVPLRCLDKLDEYLLWKTTVANTCGITVSDEQIARCEIAKRKLNELEDPRNSEQCGPFFRGCWLKYNKNRDPNGLGEHVLEFLQPNVIEKNEVHLCPLDLSDLQGILDDCLAASTKNFIDHGDPYSLATCLKDKLRDAIGELDPDDFPNANVDDEHGFVCTHYSLCMSQMLDLAGLANDLAFFPGHVWNVIHQSAWCDQHLDCLNDINIIELDPTKVPGYCAFPE